MSECVCVCVCERERERERERVVSAHTKNVTELLAVQKKQIKPRSQFLRNENLHSRTALSALALHERDKICLTSK